MEFLIKIDFDNERIVKGVFVKVVYKIGDVDEFKYDIGVVYVDFLFIFFIFIKNFDYDMIFKIVKDVYEVLKWGNKIF